MVDSVQGARVAFHRIVSYKQEEIHRLFEIDSIQEPLLPDHCLRRDDLRRIGIASKVKEHTERHDPEAMLGGEVSILVSNAFILPGGIVVDLHI